MKDVIQTVLLLLFGVYITVSMCALAKGYTDAKPFLGIRSCDEKETRGSLLVPAYRLGCYLGEPLNE